MVTMVSKFFTDDSDTCVFKHRLLVENFLRNQLAQMGWNFSASEHAVRAFDSYIGDSLDPTDVQNAERWLDGLLSGYPDESGYFQKQWEQFHIERLGVPMFSE